MVRTSSASICAEKRAPAIDRRSERRASSVGDAAVRGWPGASEAVDVPARSEIGIVRTGER